MAVLVALTFCSEAIHAGTESAGPAGKLSAALGGTLDTDLGEAGALAHEIDYASLTLRPGRSVEYRRRVALELRLASTSVRLADSSAIPSRTANGPWGSGAPAGER